MEKINCPQCGKLDTWHKENSFRPFCSERCKLIDLGAWASGGYRVGAETSTTIETDEEN